MLSIFTNQRVCLEFIWTVYMYIYVLEFARLSNFQGLSSVVLVWTRADTIECKLKSYRNSNSMYIHYAYGLAFIVKYFKCVLGVLPYHIYFFDTSKCAANYAYRISSYSFRGNYSFLNLVIQRSQYIRPKVTVHKGTETIQGRKLFKGGNYSRAETI